MSASIPRHARRRQPIYWLPNLFTTLCLLAGFWAIIRAHGGDLNLAAVAIVLAALFDSLDGRIARIVGAESLFGRDYDSLADLVSFGVAPALLAFYWGLEELGRIGFAICFLYCAATAIRLARFNVTQRKERIFFNGLPSPIAGVIVATSVSYAGPRESISDAVIMAVLVFFIAITMVSTIKFYSFKDINLKATITPQRIVLILLGFSLLIAIFLEFRLTALLLVAWLYIFSGYWFFLRRMKRFIDRARSVSGSTLGKALRKMFFHE